MRGPFHKVLYNLVSRFPAGKYFVDPFCSIKHHTDHSLMRCACTMRSHNYLIHMEKRIIRHSWLRVTHIQTGACNFLISNSPFQCRFIYDFYTGGINLNCRRLHDLEFMITDTLNIFWRRRDVDTDIVRLCQQFIPIMYQLYLTNVSIFS